MMKAAMVPAPYTYRNPFNQTDPAELAKSCIAALEDEIRFQGAGIWKQPARSGSYWVRKLALPLTLAPPKWVP